MKTAVTHGHQGSRGVSQRQCFRDVPEGSCAGRKVLESHRTPAASDPAGWSPLRSPGKPKGWRSHISYRKCCKDMKAPILQNTHPELTRSKVPEAMPVAQARGEWPPSTAKGVSCPSACTKPSGLQTPLHPQILPKGRACTPRLGYSDSWGVSSRLRL